MICFRCEKELGHADASNADYIISEDSAVNEERDCLVAVHKDKRTEIASISDARSIPGCTQVEARKKRVRIQKTALICPSCYREGDYVIWGVHKDLTKTDVPEVFREKTEELLPEVYAVMEVTKDGMVAVPAVPEAIPSKSWVKAILGKLHLQLSGR